MTIQVEINKKPGQNPGDWIVRNGPGGTIISRHKIKTGAVQRGRKEARKRNTDLKIQDTNGRWSQSTSYR